MIPRHLYVALLALVALVAICDAVPSRFSSSSSSSSSYSSSSGYKKHYRGKGYRYGGNGGGFGIFGQIFGLFGYGGGNGGNGGGGNGGGGNGGGGNGGGGNGGGGNGGGGNGGGGNGGGGSGGDGDDSFGDYYGDDDDCSEEECPEGQDLYCWRCTDASDDEDCFSDDQPGWEKCYSGQDSVCIYKYHTNNDGEVCKVSRGCIGRDDCYEERQKARSNWRVECHIDGEGAECCTPAEWETWTSWSTCVKTCGPEYSIRTRECGDTDCPVKVGCGECDIEKRDCKNPCCPNLGIWSTWTEWTCRDECGDTVQSRNRTCNRDPDIIDFCDEFYCEGDDSQEVECFAGCCQHDGVPGPYGPWQCVDECGITTEFRNRSCLPNPNYDPWYIDECPPECDEPLSEENTCFNECCFHDGVPSEWSQWICVDSCGITTEYRNRTCEDNDNYPPEEAIFCPPICDEHLSEEQTCDAGPCGCPDTEVGEWTQWECAESCGTTTESRNRTCGFPDGSNPGPDCIPDCDIQLDQIRTCYAGPCDEECPDGVPSEWGGWSNCSVDCGDGVEKRDRDCVFPPGVTVPPDCEPECDENTVFEETRPCHVPIPDVYYRSEWGEWGTCQSSCTQERKKTCDKRCPTPDPCPNGDSLFDSRPCSGGSCSD